MEAEASNGIVSTLLSQNNILSAVLFALLLMVGTAYRELQRKFYESVKEMTDAVSQTNTTLALVLENIRRGVGDR